MCKIEILAFLSAFLVAGILWGYLENFLFWHLEDLGATKFLMGMSLAVGTLAGLPMTMFSKLLIQTLGHRKIVTIALLLYAMRMFGFAELSKSILKIISPDKNFNLRKKNFFKALSRSKLISKILNNIRQYWQMLQLAFCIEKNTIYLVMH